MNYLQLFQNTIYRIVTAIAVPIATYYGLKLSDQLFGSTSLENIYNSLLPHLNIEELKAKHNSKKASDILYNSTTIFYGNGNSNKHKIKEAIYKAYEALEQDDIRKYFVYVNALNSIKENSSSEPLRAHLFLHNESWLYSLFLKIGVFFSTSEVLGCSDDDSNYILFKGKSTFDVNIVAHEMVHSAYSIVYNNNGQPFNTKETEAAYRKIQDELPTITKNYLKPFYEPEKIGKEMVAYYVGNGDDSGFPGFKAFIQDYTIPDFIKYIENHPSCDKINYSDDSIHCEVAGDNISLTESEL